MLRALLASGALLQGLKASISAQVGRIATLAGGALVALIFFNIGLAALAFAAAIALTQLVGGALAAAIVGLGAILIGALVMWVASRASRGPASASSTASSTSSGFPALPGMSAGGTPPLPWMLAAAAIGLLLARGSGRRDDD